MKKFSAFLVLSSLLLAACAGTPPPDLEATVQAALAATQAAQPTDTPAPTSTPRPTNTLVPTWTPTLTNTPTVTPTPTATPTDTPAPTNTPAPTSTPVPAPTDTLEPPTSTPLPATTGEVALVTDGGKIKSSGSYAQYVYEGMLRAANEFGLAPAFIEPLRPDDFERSIEQFVDEDYDLIVTVSFMMGDVTKRVAQAHPDINFAIVDFAYDPPIPNVMGLAFREDQAGFMAGALAGMMTKSKTVGVVGGMPVPAVKKFCNGYENGVKYVCPDCNVIEVYTDSFTDPAQGKGVAETQIAQSADVIFGAGGLTGTGGILFAAQQGVWVIGVDTDEYYTTFKGGQEAGADKLLSSAMKRVDVAAYTAIREVQAGTFEGRTAVLDASANGVGLAPFHQTEDVVPQEVKDRLDEIFRMLASGELDTGVDAVSGDLK